MRPPARLPQIVSSEVPEPHVLILLAVRNGARHLAAQLDSIAAQEHRRWSLLVSDDGSDDESLQILTDFARCGHDVTVLGGPCLGPAENFMSLFRRAAPFLTPDSFIATCDQDDVWFPSRLRFGIERLQGIAADHPAMVFHKTLITDEALQNPRPSAPRPRKPGFRNALVQNIAAGNTILLNAGASTLICAAAAEPDCVVMHDWWSYLIVTGAGGIALQDDRPVLFYRQHGRNEVGANDGLRARLRRVSMVYAGTFRAWNDINLQALTRSAHRLTPEHRATLALFAAARRGGLGARFAALWRARLYRQSGFSTLALWVAAGFRRL
jgi:glycosyltransferase involved in cell wall biosynthesis